MTKRKATHTPGPWRTDGFYIRNADGDILAKMYRFMGDDGEYTHPIEANARLIAAAPETKEQRDELLDALKALHACHRAFSSAENWTMLDDEAREAAEAAIAKAEGRS